MTFHNFVGDSYSHSEIKTIISDNLFTIVQKEENGTLLYNFRISY